VQITAGSETSGIDIQFSRDDKFFDVTGRVVDAEKGSPIVGSMVAYSIARPVTAREESDKVDIDDDVLVGTTFPGGTLPGGFTTTNDKGEFRFKSVAPGRYRVDVAPSKGFTGLGTTDFYADSVAFEVTSANVDRLEVKVHRGAAISGSVVVENGDGPNGLESYGQMMLLVTVTNPQAKLPSMGSGSVSSDGSFRVGGLKAGKATFQPLSLGEERPILVRIERNGIELQGGVEIQANEQLSGLRIVITSPNCVIRGHVTIQGGTLPQGAILTATAHPQNEDLVDASDNEPVDVDANGNFVIDKLAPAVYVVEVSVAVRGRPRSQNLSTKQTVTTLRGEAVEVNLVLDLAGKSSDR
jgi:hypothetical protein